MRVIVTVTVSATKEHIQHPDPSRCCFNDTNIEAPLSAYRRKGNNVRTEGALCAGHTGQAQARIRGLPFAVRKVHDAQGTSERA